MKEELRWGLFIGLAQLVWLYGSFFLGMHTNGLALIQVMTLVSFGILIVGLVLGLRAAKRREKSLPYTDGVKSGIIIAAVAAIMAVVSQLGYFLFIHPEWTEFMVEETRKYYGDQVTGEQLEEIVAGARKTFGMKSYLIQSGVGTFAMGVIISAIIMIFLRERRPPPIAD